MFTSAAECQAILQIPSKKRPIGQEKLSLNDKKTKVPSVYLLLVYNSLHVLVELRLIYKKYRNEMK